MLLGIEVPLSEMGAVEVDPSSPPGSDASFIVELIPGGLFALVTDLEIWRPEDLEGAPFGYAVQMSTGPGELYDCQGFDYPHQVIAFLVEELAAVAP